MVEHANGTVGEDYRVEFVRVFLHENLHRHLVTNELARLVNLSDSRLRHLFAAQTGVSIGKYLRAARLEKAKDLLTETYMSIDEVAIKVGWQDRSHFERSFKQSCHLTPAQYRGAHRRKILLNPTRSQPGHNSTAAARK